MQGFPDISHLTAFNTLKGALWEAPILHYPDPSKCYTVYTDTLYDACGAQLSKEHDGQELPVAFLLYIFTDTQQKWSTTEQWSVDDLCRLYFALLNLLTDQFALALV